MAVFSFKRAKHLIIISALWSGSCVADITLATHAYQAKQYGHAVTLLRPQLASNPEAQYLMAQIHQQGGHGVAKNLHQAISWYSKAASANYAPACYALGQIFERGIDINPNYSQARIWYQKGALLQDLKSQHALAAMLLEGRGGAKNQLQGLAWMQLAAQNGEAQAARYLQQQLKTLTPDMQFQLQNRIQAIQAELITVTPANNPTRLTINAKESK
jgi:hypothetical protein